MMKLDFDALVAAAGLRHFSTSKKDVADTQNISDMLQLTLKCEGWIFGVPISMPALSIQTRLPHGVDAARVVS
ncbi:MAG: hypothetical protein K2Q32_05285 [Alphaproteobacteria bacterium]|nr:hypothetical protein [Alphaproteobacteria bacterium]